MEIKNNLLTGRNVMKMKESPNHSGEFKKGNLDSIVLHFTTGGTAKPAINTLTNPKVRASAHVVIDRDGSITQLLPFNLVAWHAGRSYYQGRSGYNHYSIGIEMVNAGHLTKSGNIYRAWYGEAFNPSDVIEAIHKNHTKPQYWHVFTSEQITATRNLCLALIDTYKIKHILGHDEIAPKRKTDPGPAFPMDKFRNDLLGSSRKENEAPELPDMGRVTASSLNIRSRPKNGAAKIANALPQGTKVHILDKSGGWYKVAVEVKGWVYGKYIQYD